MQRGITRRRSSFDDQGGDCQRRPQRPRLSRDIAPTSPTTPATIVTASTEAPRSPPLRAMGPPRSTNGGAASRATPTPGPSLPSALLDQVERFYPLGDLMYADDADWVNEDDADIIVEASADASQDRGARIRRQQRFGRRMPIQREQVVRLMLQGLQDIGYQYVVPREHRLTPKPGCSCAGKGVGVLVGHPCSARAPSCSDGWALVRSDCSAA